MPSRPPTSHLPLPAASTTPAAALARFRRLRLVVWGDFIADEFIYGEISRVSREAPVLILRHREQSLVPGGGANTAANLAALGVQVKLIGVIGDDAAGRALRRFFAQAGMDLRGLLTVPGWPTPSKTRILAGHSHTTRQQIVRLDREPGRALPEAMVRRLRARAARACRGADGLIVCDYGYGSVSPSAVQPAPAWLPAGAPFTVDARFTLAGYRGLTAATPNEEEVEEIFHAPIGDNRRRLDNFGRRLLRQLRASGLLITRGRDGMALFQPRRRTLHIPISGNDQAVDVTGAGDTVIAVFTAALASGAGMELAARLANAAAGIVVMKPGTAVVQMPELLAAAQRMSPSA